MFVIDLVGARFCVSGHNLRVGKQKEFAELEG